MGSRTDHDSTSEMESLQKPSEASYKTKMLSHGRLAHKKLMKMEVWDADYKEIVHLLIADILRAIRLNLETNHRMNKSEELRLNKAEINCWVK